jgi:hypothetical protein
MSGKRRDQGRTRRSFGVILGGLAVGAVVGTTAVANAGEGGGAGQAGRTGPDTSHPGAADVVIRHEDIDGLAVKLDALALTDNERALLVGLLTVATDVISRADTDHSVSPHVSTVNSHGTLIGVRKGGRVPSIREQFTNAFMPGAVHETAVTDVGKIIKDP